MWQKKQSEEEVKATEEAKQGGSEVMEEGKSIEEGK